ncbi:hypothetical protein Barb6_01173 [Bacteroidales bacterium Barb6]|nr:hypothetical protein Barb6_01173 [Bacteroidales bacterium Barb6]
MERLLHYVWAHKLYDAPSLITVDGIPVEVLDPGIRNTDAGPDFFNAKIKAGGMVWAGNVEIHDKASDWMRHHHDIDKAYDSVILHVTGKNDAMICQTNGTPIPQLVLTVPEPVRKNIDWLLLRDDAIPCRHFIGEIDPLHLTFWTGALLCERMERKTADIAALLEQQENDWNEVFYIVLTRNFGFGVNSNAFEQLARSLPFRCIQKQRNSYSQVEALLFGQAGMLDEAGDCAYYRLLQREYRFLQHKFGLKPLDASLFKGLRVRPGNFPHQRLAQLAAIWTAHDTLFSKVLEAATPGQLKSCFRVLPSDYWKTHFHFRHASPEKEKPIGEDTLNGLLINTVAPMLFAYGQRNGQPECSERALRLLERLPAEKNNIVATFSRAGFDVRNAGDSQALIQLKRAYCETKKCLYCRIGFRLLSFPYFLCETCRA